MAHTRCPQGQASRSLAWENWLALAYPRRMPAPISPARGRIFGWHPFQANDHGRLTSWSCSVLTYSGQSARTKMGSGPVEVRLRWFWPSRAELA